MLIDQAKIYVSGGPGGDGCNSLYKDIFHRKGIPDGGDGGAGGDVIIRSDPNLQTLLDLRYNQHHNAAGGRHGGSNKKFGRRGEDRIVRVPVGTIVKDAGNDLVMRDLDRPGEEVIAARGGAGGLGSAKVREARKGEAGEKKTLVLELKLVADAGIIGFPNAGKSTLVSKVSKVHTKIAPYPFTTKEPRLGVVKTDDDTCVVADMPGLIEGAHAGKGLGDRFLRHIERTLVLVHVVEMAPLDGSDPADNFYKLEKELELYGHEVSGKPRLVVASKMDTEGSEENFEKFRKEIDKDVIVIAALEGRGLKELVHAIMVKVQDARKETEKDNGQDRYESPDGQE